MICYNEYVHRKKLAAKNKYKKISKHNTRYMSQLTWIMFCPHFQCDTHAEWKFQKMESISNSQGPIPAPTFPCNLPWILRLCIPILCLKSLQCFSDIHLPQLNCTLFYELQNHFWIFGFSKASLIENMYIHISQLNRIHISSSQDIKISVFLWESCFLYLENNTNYKNVWGNFSI